MRMLTLALVALVTTPATALTILDSNNNLQEARENGQPWLRYSPYNTEFRVEVDRANMRARVPYLQTGWGLSSRGDAIAEEERTEVIIIPPSDPFDVEQRIERTEGWKGILTWSYAGDFPEYGPTTGAEDWAPIQNATGDAPYVTWPNVWAEMPETIVSTSTVNIWQWEGDYANRYLAEVIELGTTVWTQPEAMSAPLTMGITGTPRWPAWKISFDTPLETTSYVPEAPVEYTVTDRWGEEHALTRTHLESWLQRGEYAFLPIPEPSSLALALVTMAGIAWWRAGRRSSARSAIWTCCRACRSRQSA
jgi:hypothetical protein